MMRLGRIVLAGACLFGAGCKGDDGEPSSLASTTTISTTTTTIALTTSATTPGSTTSTTAATKVGGRTVDAPATTTTTTPRPAGSTGVTTSDAPRDPTVDRSDNTGSFTFGPNPRQASSTPTANPKDPLTFTVSCVPNPDGHGNCHLELTNHVDRTAQFPGGLKITITMQRNGGSAIDFVHDLPNVTSLAPGEHAIVDATFDITEPGDYEYFATTTVHWP
jgi:hypothetical protein